MQPSSTTPCVTAIACCRNTLCNLLVSLHVTRLWSLTCTSHLSGSNGMLFFVLGACTFIMLPSWELLAWGEMQTEAVVGQRAVAHPCGWVVSVVFSSLDNQVAKKMCCTKTACGEQDAWSVLAVDGVCLNTAAQTRKNWVKTLKINSSVIPLNLSGCPPCRMDVQWAPFNNTCSKNFSPWDKWNCKTQAQLF